MSDTSESTEPSVSQHSAEDEQSIINTSADPQVEFSQSAAAADDRPTSSSIVGESTIDPTSASPSASITEPANESAADEPSNDAVEGDAVAAADVEPTEVLPAETAFTTSPVSPSSISAAAADLSAAPVESQELTYSTVSGPSSLTSSMHEPLAAIMRQPATISKVHHTGEQSSEAEQEMELVMEVVTEQATAPAAEAGATTDAAPTEPSTAAQPSPVEQTDNSTSTTPDSLLPVLSGLPAPYADDPLADNPTTSRSTAVPVPRAFIPPRSLPNAGSSDQPTKHFPADFTYPSDSSELSRPLRPFHLSPQYIQLHQSFSFNVQQRYNLHYIDTHTLLYIAGNTAQLHDYQTGKKLVVHGHTHDDSGGVASIALHPSRSCFAVAEKGSSPNIYIYSYPQLQVIRILRRGTELAYSHIEFNGSGDKLASVGSHPDYTLAVWEWSAERVILKTKAFSQAVYRVSFAPSDDGRLITAGVGHIRFWDMARTFTGLKLQGAIGKFGGVELSDISAYVELPDGRVLSGSESGRLLMWDGHLIQYQVVQLNDSPCHAGEISVVRLRAGGSEIVTAGADGWVRVWSYAALEYAEVSEDDPYIRLQPLQAMQIDARCHIVSLIDGEADEWLIQDSHGAIHAYSQLTEYRRQLLSVHAGGINALVTSPNSHTATTAGDDCTVRCYDFYTGRQLYSRTFNAGATALLYAPLSADNQQTTLIAGFADGTMRILHRYLEAFQVAAAFKPHRSPIRHIAINHGGTILVTAASNADLFFFAVTANTHCTQLAPIGTASFGHNIAGLTFSLDGRKLLLACGPAVLEVDVPGVDGWEEKERDTYTLELTQREWRYEIREKAREDDEEKNREERDADDKRRREREEDMTDDERERERAKREAREERRRKRVAKRKEEEERVYHISTVLYAPNSTTSFYFTLAPPPNSSVPASAYPPHKTETLHLASFSSPVPSRSVPLGPSIGHITALAYTPSQSHLLLGSSHGTVQVRSMHDLLYCFRLQSHDSAAAVSGLGGSFDEQFVLSCGADGQLFCWVMDAVGGLAMVDRTVEQLAVVERERRLEERRERAKKRAEDDDRRKKERKAKAAGKKLEAKDKVESKEAEAEEELSDNEQEDDDLSHLSTLIPAAAVVTTAPTAPNSNASYAASAVVPLPQPTVDSLSTSTAAGVSDVTDTLNATSYSIEEAKAKAEEDDRQLDLQRQQQSIAEQIDECRTQYNRLIALKKQYDSQLADTVTMLPDLPGSAAVDPALFDLDPDLPTHIHHLTNQKTAELQASLAWEIELHQLQLAKLQRHFLEPVEVESFVVRPFGLVEGGGEVGEGDVKGVWSYRVGRMPQWLVDEIAAVHRRVEQEEASKRKQEEERQRRVEAEQKEAQAPIHTVVPSSPNSSRKTPFSAASPTSPTHSSLDSRYQQRQQRQQQIDQLLAQRPDPSLPSAAQLAQLATVQSGIGDYKLKSAADYIVPEERKVNVDRKRRRMLLLVDAMYAMKQQFNGRLDEMRQLKQRLATSISSDLQRIHGIVGELRAAGSAGPEVLRVRGVPAGFVERLHGLVGGEVRRDEWPEKRGEFSEAELHKFVARKKLEEKAKLGGQDSQAEEASRPATAAPVAPKSPAAASNRLSPDKKARGLSEAEEKQQPAQDSTQSLTVLASPRNNRKPPSILAATRTHLRQQQLTATLHSLVRHLYTSLHSFNQTLNTLASTRLTLSDDLLNAQLRLLTYHEELTVLKEYEEKEQTLEERGRRGKEGRRQLEAEMADVERSLNARMRDMAGCHDKDKALLTEFVNAVGGEKNEFYSILLRLYRRKIKRRNKTTNKRTASATNDKSTGDGDGKAGDGNKGNKSDKSLGGGDDGGGGDGGNNNSSNNSDSDDSDDDSDTESVLSTSSSLHSNSDDDEDEVCPPHCPTVAYERTIELRERRVENEEVMETLQKNISDMGKMYERLMAKVKTMEKEARKLEEEMQMFQSDKQKALNQIEVSLPLHLSQIVHLQANDQNNQRYMNDGISSSSSHYSGSGGYYQLPGQLHDCIVFPLDELQRVKQRETQLMDETITIDTQFQKVKTVAKNITKEMDVWQSRISEEQKRCENVQLLKFGRLVDLSFLLDDDGEWSKTTSRMQSQLREMEMDKSMAVKQWEGEISHLKQQYEQLLVTNTKLLEDVADLTNNQYQLEGKLNSTNSILSMGLTDNAHDERDRREKDELCRLVEVQEREIEALKAEMSVLRRKGGHVYAV